MRAVPDGSRRIGWTTVRPWRDVKWGLLGLLLSLPLVFGVTQAAVRLGESLGQPRPDDGHVMLKMMRESPSLAATALIVFGAIVLAPVLEEITFRGLTQTALRRLWSPHPRRRWPVILAAAAVFAGVHAPAVAWQAIPALFALGVVMGWLYEKTGSLWPSIVLHMGFNATNVTLMFLSGPRPT
jgi:membrane protease YdiL (CAAX protease family)